MSKVKLRLRAALLAAIVVSSPPLGYAGYRYASGNIHEVEPGVLYRSGQLDGATLQGLIDAKNIRAIINLRGSHPDQRWYAEEASIAEGNDIRYVSIAISARSIPDMDKMVRIAEAMRDLPRPILVHCMGGSDRAGLASAIFELVEGKPFAMADDQLSIAYGHFPWLGSKTGAMDRAFTQFAAYWAAGGADAVAAEDEGRATVR